MLGFRVDLLPNYDYGFLWYVYSISYCCYVVVIIVTGTYYEYTVARLSLSLL